MKSIRARLTYANVMSSIAVFLVVGGASAVAATQLPKNSVGAPQLKGSAVTQAKIKKNAVSAGKIRAGAVGGAKIGAGAVSTEKLADASVSTEKLGDGAVATAKIGDGQVTATKIADASIGSAKIDDGQVRAADLGAITQVQANDTVATNSSKVLDVACPAESRLIGGGGGINLAGPPAGVSVTASLRVSINEWRVIVRNDSGEPRPAFVQVYCLEK